MKNPGSCEPGSRRFSCQLRSIGSLESRNLRDDTAHPDRIARIGGGIAEDGRALARERAPFTRGEAGDFLADAKIGAIGTAAIIAAAIVIAATAIAAEGDIGIAAATGGPGIGTAIGLERDWPAAEGEIGIAAATGGPGIGAAIGLERDWPAAEGEIGIGARYIALPAKHIGAGIGLERDRPGTTRASALA